MDYLNQTACALATEAIRKAIEDAKNSIRQCSSLAHKDAKLEDKISVYFSSQADEYTNAANGLRRLMADLSQQSHISYLREQEAAHE